VYSPRTGVVVGKNFLIRVLIVRYFSRNFGFGKPHYRGAVTTWICLPHQPIIRKLYPPLSFAAVVLTGRCGRDKQYSATQRPFRPIVWAPRASAHDHHSSLQQHPALPGPGRDRDRVVARSSAVVAPSPLPPPVLLPEMPTPTIRRLDVASPVPADIDIANSVEPLPIADIASELGLRPEHYDLYGKYKAKVLS
jgi:hypothetical protein